jgi:tRNA pseudouridine55 synthase
VGPFRLSDAHTLESLGEDFSMLSMTQVATRCFPTYSLDAAGEADVRVGRKLELDLGASGPVAVLSPAGEFLALYEQRGRIAAAVAVFCG